MAKTDLSVDELADAAVSYLGELLAPVSAFTVLPTTSSRVKSTGTGGGVYQVEVTGSRPAGGKNPGNYETDLTSGSQDAVAVTTANVAVLQTLTNLEQQQGIPFMVKVEDAAKGFSEAIWDDITAMMNAGAFTDAGVANPYAVTDAQDLRASVDSRTCVLMIQHSVAGPLYPSDRESFGFAQPGAYGFDSIYPVSNFTGGKANQLSFACSTEAAVAVTGPSLQDSDNESLTRSLSMIENISLAEIGLNAEMRIWQNTATKDLHCTIESIFGISAADTSAGAYQTSV